METSNLSLAYIVAELKPLVEGAFVNSVQQVNETVFKIKLHNKEHGTLELIATPNAVYKTSYKLQVQAAQTGFAAFLKKKLYNKRVLAFEQHGFDRIIEMRFLEFDLVFELFARGNIILKEKGGKIVSCYKSEQWRDREIKRNAQYKYPATKPSIIETSEKDFEKILKDGSQDCVRAIVSAVNVAPIAVEEACAIAGVQKEKKSSMLSEKKTRALCTALNGLYTIEHKKAKPVVIELAGGQQLLPFPFETVSAEKTKPFASLSEALDENITADFLKTEEKQLTKGLEQKKAKLQYSQAEQLKAKARLEKEMLESKQKAELIYANYSEIKELAGAINAALEKKISRKDIMYKLKIAAEEGNKSAKLLLDVDPKTRKTVLDLPSS